MINNRGGVRHPLRLVKDIETREDFEESRQRDTVSLLQSLAGLKMAAYSAQCEVESEIKDAVNKLETEIMKHRVYR